MEVAVIAAGVYFLMSADIDKIMSTVGVENTDADGNKIYINTNVEEGGVQTKEEFKKKYFEYYDDVKDKSLKRQDW